MQLVFFIVLLVVSQNPAFAQDPFAVSATSELINIQCEKNKFATMTVESTASSYNELTYKVHCLPLICVYQRVNTLSSQWNIYLLGKNTTTFSDSSLLVRPHFFLLDEKLSATARDQKLKSYLQDGLCVESKKEIMFPYL